MPLLFIFWVTGEYIYCNSLANPPANRTNNLGDKKLLFIYYAILYTILYNLYFITSALRCNLWTFSPEYYSEKQRFLTFLARASAEVEYSRVMTYELLLDHICLSGVLHLLSCHGTSERWLQSFFHPHPHPHMRR